MPCLEIVTPRLLRDKKELIATGLTEVFCSVTGHESSIFGIRFHEYDLADAAMGGRLCDQENVSPYLHFVLYCPRLKRSQKQKLIEELSTVFSKAVEKPTWLPVIHIAEHPYDNVGFQGKLLSDLFEDCRKREFYYSLKELE